MAASFATVFMFRAVTVRGTGNLQLRARHVCAVVHVDFLSPQTNFLVDAAGNAAKNVFAGLSIEEDRHVAIPRRMRKWIAAQYLSHFGGGAYENVNGLPCISEEPALELLPYRRLTEIAFENYVSARDECSNGVKAGSLTHRLEIRHGKLAGSPNIHGAQQRDEGCHRFNMHTGSHNGRRC